MTEARAFLPQGSATIDDLSRLDLRIGRIVEALAFPEARRSAYRLRIDLGAGGIRTSSAQLPGTYPDPSLLVGRLVVCVANLPPRRIAGLVSEVLVLGALPADGRIRSWVSMPAPSRATRWAERHVRRRPPRSRDGGRDGMATR